MNLSSRAKALLAGAAMTFGAAAVACTPSSSADDAEAAELAALCGGEPAGTPSEVPDDLRCTGLYAKWSDKTVAPQARAFTPAAPLWSDGMEKHRWVLLPDGATVDASKMDDWSFPVGTKAWKEFSVSGRRVETRFMWKVRSDRWLQASYVWSPDGASAKRGEGTEIEVEGKPYVVPKSTDCNSCHAGRKDKLLGFEAVNLALPGATGLTLETLVAEQRISPLPARTKIDLPDDGTGKSGPALAWMHTNCGVSCHSATDDAIGGRVGLRLRLAWDDVTGARAPAAWDARATTLGVLARTADWAGRPRIAPGDPASSLLVELVETRGPGQMPKLGTNVVDRAGVDALRAWISAMGPGGPAAAGAPPPPASEDPGAAPLPAGSACLPTSVAEVEGNDAEATANTIPGANGTYCGTIGQDGDVDVLTFTAPATFAGISLKAATTDDRLAVTVSANGGAPVTLGQGAVPAVKGGAYVVKVSGPAGASYRITLTLR